MARSDGPARLRRRPEGSGGANRRTFASIRRAEAANEPRDSCRRPGECPPGTRCPGPRSTGQSARPAGARGREWWTGRCRWHGRRSRKCGRSAKSSGSELTCTDERSAHDTAHSSHSSHSSNIHANSGEPGARPAPERRMRAGSPRFPAFPARGGATASGGSAPRRMGPSQSKRGRECRDGRPWPGGSAGARARRPEVVKCPRS